MEVFNSEIFLGRLPFLYAFLLFVIGLFGLISKENLVKKLIGMNIMQAAVILFFIVHAYKKNASVPIWDETLGTTAASYVNPIPHALMLTAIVVSVATTGVALSLIIKIYRQYKTLDESQLLK